MDDCFHQFGQRMRLKRKEMHLTQSKLAEILGISNNHVSSIENGREKPSIDLLYKICEAINTTPDFLLLGSTRLNNVSQNIVDSLKLCSNEDLDIINEIVQLYVRKNSGNQKQ